MNHLLQVTAGVKTGMSLQYSVLLIIVIAAGIRLQSWRSMKNYLTACG